jgi:hypothetical protein
MYNNFKLERVTENNSADFLKLINKLARYEKKNPPNKSAQKRLMDDAISENPKYYGYLGKLDSKYIGYIIFYFTYSSGPDS